MNAASANAEAGTKRADTAPASSLFTNSEPSATLTEKMIRNSVDTSCCACNTPLTSGVSSDSKMAPTAKNQPIPRIDNQTPRF